MQTLRLENSSELYVTRTFRRGGKMTFEIVARNYIYNLLDIRKLRDLHEFSKNLHSTVKNIPRNLLGVNVYFSLRFCLV